MEHYIINKKTGRRYKVTIAINKMIQKFIRNTPNKMFIAPCPDRRGIYKAYICYNTEYQLPEGFVKEN